ncbi:MAG: sulfurtransferase TusA family protein [Magnetococcales bacterium]|nr:sulfurtransferase TusA family protein [Magnetococcales bacterium]
MQPFDAHPAVLRDAPPPPPGETFHRQVDARRRLCPMPILLADGALRGMAPGEILSLLVSDAGITRDLPAWCQVNGHQLLSLERRGPEWVGLVRKGG